MNQEKLDLTRLFALAEILQHTEFREWCGSVRACADRIAALPPQVWQDIASAPKEPLYRDPQCDFFLDREHGPVVQLWNGEGWRTHPGWWCPVWNCWRYLEDDGPNDMQPTHWCPLSPPPAAEIERRGK